MFRPSKQLTVRATSAHMNMLLSSASVYWYSRALRVRNNWLKQITMNVVCAYDTTDPLLTSSRLRFTLSRFRLWCQQLLEIKPYALQILSNAHWAGIRQFGAVKVFETKDDENWQDGCAIRVCVQASAHTQRPIPSLYVQLHQNGLDLSAGRRCW